MMKFNEHHYDLTINQKIILINKVPQKSIILMWKLNDNQFIKYRSVMFINNLILKKKKQKTNHGYVQRLKVEQEKHEILFL